MSIDKEERKMHAARDLSHFLCRQDIVSLSLLGIQSFLKRVAEKLVTFLSKLLPSKL